MKLSVWRHDITIENTPIAKRRPKIAHPLSTPQPAHIDVFSPLSVHLLKITQPLREFVHRSKSGKLLGAQQEKVTVHDGLTSSFRKDVHSPSASCEADMACNGDLSLLQLQGRELFVAKNCHTRPFFFFFFLLYWYFQQCHYVVFGSWAASCEAWSDSDDDPRGAARS